MPKRIGIVTLYGTLNYGNRLQNLAIHTCLAKRGFIPETIVWRPKRLKWYFYPAWILVKSRIFKDPKTSRTNNFLRFIRKYTPDRAYFSKDHSVPRKICDRYDYFVTGSDQVWNVRLLGASKRIEAYFLTFAEDRKKICISPSIGESRVGDANAAWMREKLQGFRYLSCREKQGAEELSRITGQPCEWLIDPTLSITGDEWRKLLSIRPESRKKPYLFVFFLDGMTPELTQFVREYAANRYEIIDPSDSSGPWFSIDPAMFVTLLSGAHMVFTDSFHVTAFSINFHVPFHVFTRKRVKGMTSRIESICELCQLQSRYIPEQKPFEIQETCDFSQADRQLAVEREKFSAYLDKCFEA